MALWPHPLPLLGARCHKGSCAPNISGSARLARSAFCRAAARCLLRSSAPGRRARRRFAWQVRRIAPVACPAPQRCPPLSASPCVAGVPLPRLSWACCPARSPGLPSLCGGLPSLRFGCPCSVRARPGSLLGSRVPPRCPLSRLRGRLPPAPGPCAGFARFPVACGPGALCCARLPPLASVPSAACVCPLPFLGRWVLPCAPPVPAAPAGAPGSAGSCDGPAGPHAPFMARGSPGELRPGASRQPCRSPIVAAALAASAPMRCSPPLTLPLRFVRRRGLTFSNICAIMVRPGPFGCICTPPYQVSKSGHKKSTLWGGLLFCPLPGFLVLVCRCAPSPFPRCAGKLSLICQLPDLRFLSCLI